MRMGFKEALLVTVSHRGWVFEWVPWQQAWEIVA
jgi:hypothetical protein